MEKENEEIKEVKNFSNYQYPKKSKSETFDIILIGKNFLILKNKDGNNIRVKCFSTNLYSIGEKIHKENGKFTWEKE